MAISTYRVFLMQGASESALAKLVDIKDFPDLGGAPEMLETTTLSDAMQTFILGIQKLGALEFTTNYTVEDFKKIKALEEQELKFAVYFGAAADGTPDGHLGKFTFPGKISVYPVGAGVNAVVDIKITIAPSAPIEFDA